MLNENKNKMQIWRRKTKIPTLKKNFTWYELLLPLLSHQACQVLKARNLLIFKDDILIFKDNIPGEYFGIWWKYSQNIFQILFILYICTVQKRSSRKLEFFSELLLRLNRIKKNDKFHSRSCEWEHTNFKWRTIT